MVALGSAKVGGVYIFYTQNAATLSMVFSGFGARLATMKNWSLLVVRDEARVLFDLTQVNIHILNLL
jgi:hypothetical protein